MQQGSTEGYDVTNLEIAIAQYRDGGIFLHEDVCEPCAPVAAKIRALLEGPQHLGIGRYSVEQLKAQPLQAIIAKHEDACYAALMRDDERAREAFRVEMEAKGFVLAWDDEERDFVFVKAENVQVAA